MSIVEEEIPMMALAEDSDERQVYAYQAGVWFLATLVPGVAALGGAIWLHLAFEDIELFITLPLFVVSFLMLYSTWYSLTADQWLMFDGVHRLVRFHKKNLYGRIDWELPGSEIICIRVFAQDGENNWALQLKVDQQPNLLFGDSAFAKMSHDRALALAEKAGQLVGVRVESLSQDTI
jgi:hypothetical protein